MAVEIKKNGNKDHLDVFYHLVKDEELDMSTPTQYGFSSDTKSRLKFLDKIYIPKKIYIVPKIHESKSLNSESELILETLHNDKNKLFICIGLRFQLDSNNQEWIFPLKTPNLETLVSKCSRNYIYKTKNNNHVCVCTKSIIVNGMKPNMTISSKSAYKDIIDSDSFDMLSLVTSASSNKAKIVESKTENVQFKTMLFFHEEEDKNDSMIIDPTPSNTKEGFTTDSYMECKLLEDDGNDAYEDVAVVPLQTNTYERGLVTFSHFLHFFLVTFGAGLGFPNLFLSLFNASDFKTNGEFNTLRTIIGYSSFIIFFLVGLVIMLVGLLDPRYKKLTYNDEKIKQGSVLATIGFYLILIHCSFALGMFTFKKFAYGDFAEMFDGTRLQTSFFDILSGIR
jgi:hypothetical protein